MIATGMQSYVDDVDLMGIYSQFNLINLLLPQKENTSNTGEATINSLEI